MGRTQGRYINGCHTREVFQPGSARAAFGHAGRSPAWRASHLQAVLEDAMSSYIEARRQQNVRPEVMAHYRASLERNRRLYELLAK